MRQRSLARSTSRWKLTFSGSVESQYLVGSASPSGHSISSHSGDSVSGTSLLCPTRTRTRAKREDSHSAEPSRHLIVRQACFGKPSATSLAEIRSGSSRRPVLFSGLPFRLGPAPEDQGVRQNAGHIGQTQGRQRRAQPRVTAITDIHQNHSTWQADFARPAYLLERDLRLGHELGVFRHARLLAAGAIHLPNT